MADLALFDFDGTITSEDTFKAFVHFAVDPKRIRWRGPLLWPFIAAYRLGLVRASVMRKGIVMLGFRGKYRSDIQRLGVKFSQDYIPHVVRPKAIERMEWHKLRGDLVVIVSSSLDIYLTQWCRNQGVNLICSELEADNDILTGRYRGRDCTGYEKARRVREELDVKAFSQVYAYGDTIEDLALLNLAHKKFFRWRDVSDESVGVKINRVNAAHPGAASRRAELHQEDARLDRLNNP